MQFPICQNQLLSCPFTPHDKWHIACDKHPRCCTLFVDDCALATREYALETVHRAMKRWQEISSSAFQCHYYSSLPISGGMDVKLFSPAPRYCKFFSNLQKRQHTSITWNHILCPFFSIPVCIRSSCACIISSYVVQKDLKGHNINKGHFMKLHTTFYWNDIYLCRKMTTEWLMLYNDHSHYTEVNSTIPSFRK